jgi:hypothetical protein
LDELAATTNVAAIRETAICTKVHEAKPLTGYREADRLSIPDLKHELDGNTRLEPKGDNKMLSLLEYGLSLPRLFTIH